MPRLRATYNQALEILEQHGFVLHRQESTHRHYRGVVNGEIHLVTLAPHRWGDQIHPDTLKSIIRQSGLPKKLFRR